MRIISGFLKGKKILQPLDNNTRPLRDLVKETIFNIIQHSKENEVNLNGARILDLFSGSGSFGLECLSRGAKKVFFVENYSGISVCMYCVKCNGTQRRRWVLHTDCKRCCVV